jgi:hypothetical protein
MPDRGLNAWERAEQEQILFIARSTTPAQRMRWLEETLELFRDYLPRRDGPLPDDDAFARSFFADRAAKSGR